VKKENIFSAPVTIVSRRVIDDVKRFFLCMSFFRFHKQHKTQEDILKQTEIEEKRREEKKRKNSVWYYDHYYEKFIMCNDNDDDDYENGKGKNKL
jgi:hypothetical protein